MKIPFEHRVNWLINNLDNAPNYLIRWRYAGMLELCLQELGVIGDKLPEYKSGGKCYFPIIIDLRWKETYPEMILRIAKEYISKNNICNPSL